MPALVPLDDWGYPMYDQVIAVPRDSDYSRIDPRWHGHLQRWHPSMTAEQRLAWLDDGMRLRERIRVENEARTKIIALHRATLLAMSVSQRRIWIDQMTIQQGAHGAT